LAEPPPHRAIAFHNGLRAGIRPDYVRTSRRVLPGWRKIRRNEVILMAEVGGIAAERLRSVVERIERLEEEKAALTADIREVYAEAKGAGFDTAVLRQVVRLRKMDNAERRQREELLDLYKRVLDL